MPKNINFPRKYHTFTKWVSQILSQITSYDELSSRFESILTIVSQIMTQFVAIMTIMTQLWPKNINFPRKYHTFTKWVSFPGTVPFIEKKTHALRIFKFALRVSSDHTGVIAVFPRGRGNTSSMTVSYLHPSIRSKLIYLVRFDCTGPRIDPRRLHFGFIA